MPSIRNDDSGQDACQPPQQPENIIYIMRNAISAVVGFVGSAWQWLRLWLGSCLPVRSPDKDELAA